MRITPLAITAMLFLVVPSGGQSASAPISTKLHPEEGEYLVAGNGFALYLFKADKEDDDQEDAGRSTCEADCLAAWPPLLAEGVPAGTGSVRNDLLGTIARSDGTQQVTYGGWPLYFFAGDYAPGDVNGHDIEDFGEDWYLVGPDGSRAGEEDDDADNEDKSADD